MAWLLTLIFVLPLLQKSVTSLNSNSTQPLNHNNPSIQAIDSFPKTLPATRHASWTEKRVDNRLSKDLQRSLWPNLSVNEGSGEGSGFQKSLEVVMPSSGPLEMDMFIQDRADKQDFEVEELGAHHPPPIPQKQSQYIDDDDDDNDGENKGIISTNNNSAAVETTSTMVVQLTSHTHINSNERMNKDQPLSTTIKQITEKNSPENMHLKTFHTNVEVNNKENRKTSQDSKYIAFTQILSSITKPDTSGHNGSLMTQSGSVQGSFENVMVGEERYVSSHLSAATPPLKTGKESHEGTTSDLPVESSSTSTSVLLEKNRATDNDYSENKDDYRKPKWFGRVFGPLIKSDPSSVIGTCILGPCVVSTGGNVTRLQWEDLKRTLTFAWEVHVFGSAVLFLLVMVAATFGVIGWTNILHPFCKAFILANILLLLTGLLRFVQLIIDPYGTRNILPRPALTALYNLPIPLLLWAQATIALLALREETSPQRLLVTGGLAALHCISLLLADLLSKTLLPALPLMLQTFTICWGLLLCLGIFFQCVKQLCISHRSPLPRWSAPKRLENSSRRVLLLCALLGVFSCAVQIYSFLWLYGLLGDWRRFGWGWWLGQLSARLLELAWCFSLLLLGSRVFWKPQGSKQTAKGGEKGKQRTRLLERLQLGHSRSPDKNWAELLPNNWKDHRQSSGNVSQSVNQSMIRNHATPPTSIMTVHDKVEVIGGGVLYSSSYDHYASPLWTSGVEWQEHECVLSLIEFDIHPPSPINLHHSIDRALNHAHLLGVGSLFTPSSPSWAQNEESGGPLCDNVSPRTPASKAYRWALDTGSSSNSPEHLGSRVQQTELSVIEPLASLTPETIRKVWERDMTIPRVAVEDDCISIASGDDVTSL